MTSRTEFSLFRILGVMHAEWFYVQVCRLICCLLALNSTIYAAQLDDVIFKDNFQGVLDEGWFWEREDKSTWRVGPGGLEVRVQPGNMWGSANNAKNVLIRPIPAPKDVPVEISVTFSNSPTAQWEQANLVWFYDDSNMVKLGQELVTGRLSIVMGREENDRARTVAIIPLDDNEVELRLQAVNRQLRGQFRTRHWRQWRDVGECDLPVKGEPKASLHFYNGPVKEEHWVKVNTFTVRKLSLDSIDWPRERSDERICRFSGNKITGNELSALAIKDSPWVLISEVRNLSGFEKADCEQRIFQNKDGSCGWSWDRRASGSSQPTLAGVGLGHFNPRLQTNTSISPGGIEVIDAATPFVLELNAVTRLENDAGNHNLSVHLWLSDKATNGALTHNVCILFDWYGQRATNFSLSDGLRNYEFMNTLKAENEPIRFSYRIQGFRGAPPKINLQAFMADAIKHGLPRNVAVKGIWFGNEIWDGSRGGTLLNQVDVLINNQRRFSMIKNQK